MRPKINIDYVKQNPFTTVSINLLGIIWLTVALILWMLFSHLEETQQQRLDVAQASYQAHQQHQTKKQKPNIVDKLSDEERVYTRELVAELSTPWNPLLNSLEGIALQDLALMSIEPSKKKEQLVLNGKAKHIDAVLNYVKDLEATDDLSKVHLVKHSIDQEDSSMPVNFTILARWNYEKTQ